MISIAVYANQEKAGKRDEGTWKEETGDAPATYQQQAKQIQFVLVVSANGPSSQSTTNTKPLSLPPTLRDPANLFYQKDELRRSIIVSYWIVILLAFPLWWYTTSIERLTLPSGRVHQLAQNHLELPIRICLETADVSQVDDLRYELTTRASQDPQRWKGLAIDVVGKVDCGSMTGSDVYTVKPSKTSPGSIQKEITVSASSIGARVVNTLSSLLVPYSSSSDPEHRVVQYSSHYRLAFSLLNEDAAAGDAVMDWNIQDAWNKYINPIIHSLNALHNFTVESQVQFHAPLAFSPRQLDRFYGITPADLTVFINSAEWTLSSSSSNDPVLHFILFIPSAERRPLRILRNDDTPSPSSAFLLPQWGGIVIHNPTPGVSTNDELSPQDMHAVFLSFTHQLLGLLGVAALPKEVERSANDTGSVLSEWQLDALIRRRTLENAQGSQDTLLSIVKLVDQIENMPVGEDVRGDVEGALTALNKMYDFSSKSLYEAFAYSAKSFGLASRAFFNPGMLALLYFPAEHTYAVYTPLFASALTPLFVAALREFLAWRRERRARLGQTSSVKPS
ncbi:phosphatidylinositol-glycan biosynthesis class S protein-domain-containing protein [Flammula alnicola]|nr:phosphatidylinositol-glycan biosynthesis class S protein-domain-containing protein [Flammula alnicola]